ncbi:hypothetical protein ACFFRR_005355 [Megaselia abdita]
MNEEFKASGMNRVSSDLDRQLHVTNWLIKSRNHMTNVSTVANTAMSTQYHVPDNNRKFKLRRFHSHDVSSNIFSVADFENARLARRNEIEMKKRIQSTSKFNSLDLIEAEHYSTNESKTSKRSNNKSTNETNAEHFLQHNFLPKVVRMTYENNCGEIGILLSSLPETSSKCDVTTRSDKINNKVNMCKTDITTKLSEDVTNAKAGGEIVLLYKHVIQRNIYHAYNTKHGFNRKKEYKIPQEFTGYFSLVNEKGMPTATMYSTIMQLVRERVYKFFCVDNIIVFTDSSASNKSSINNSTFEFSRPHYVKTIASGGQVYRLLAIFEDGKNSEQIKTSSMNNFSTREKDKNRYAQLLNENRQVLYVSLSTKGKFFEIEQSMPQILQRNSISSVRGILSTSQRKINPDCVYKISTLIPIFDKNSIDLKFVGGTDQCIPENLTIFKVSSESICVICSIPDETLSQTPLFQQTLEMKPIQISKEIKFTNTLLGFESEQAMLANHNVQNILKYCQFNCDNVLKKIEINTIHRPFERHRSTIDGFSILKPLHLTKILRRQKTSSIPAHEKEDSIIFLSKNDIENISAQLPSTSTKRLSEKMKVFTPSKKKWFKKYEKNSSISLDPNDQAKRMSIDRYCDMSRLLQERFGDALANTLRESPIQEIQKCKSLQDVEFTSKPDIVPEDESIAEKYCKNNDEEKENGLQVQSFISEKMISEFHVKTREHSKSSLNLHQFLSFAKPLKDKKVYKRNISFDHSKNVLSTKSIDRNDSFDLDDLPYSNVRDSILVDNIDRLEVTNCDAALNSFIPIAENIYAEIFQGTSEKNRHRNSEDYELQEAINCVEDSYNQHSTNINVFSCSNNLE